MLLEVMGKERILCGCRRGSEAPSDSGVVVRRAGRPEIWFLLLVVSVLVKDMGIRIVGLIVVMIRVLAVLPVVWVRRVGLVLAIRRIILMKHGFVLMVVDHHPADDTVHSGPNPLL